MIMREDQETREREIYSERREREERDRDRE